MLKNVNGLEREVSVSGLRRLRVFPLNWANCAQNTVIYYRITHLICW